MGSEKSLVNKTVDEMNKSLDGLEDIRRKFVQERELFICSKDEDINHLTNCLNEYPLTPEESMLYEDVIERFKSRRNRIFDSFDIADKNLLESKNHMLDELFEIKKTKS